MQREERGKSIIASAMKAVRFLRRRRGDPVIDDFLMCHLSGDMNGLGF